MEEFDAIVVIKRLATDCHNKDHMIKFKLTLLGRTEVFSLLNDWMAFGGFGGFW